MVVQFSEYPEPFFDVTWHLKKWPSVPSSECACCTIVHACHGKTRHMCATGKSGCPSADPYASDRIDINLTVSGVRMSIVVCGIISFTTWLFSTHTHPFSESASCLGEQPIRLSLRTYHPQSKKHLLHVPCASYNLLLRFFSFHSRFRIVLIGNVKSFCRLLTLPHSRFPSRVVLASPHSLAVFSTSVWK